MLISSVGLLLEIEMYATAPWGQGRRNRPGACERFPLGESPPLREVKKKKCQVGLRNVKRVAIAKLGYTPWRLDWEIFPDVAENQQKKRINKNGDWDNWNKSVNQSIISQVDISKRISKRESVGKPFQCNAPAPARFPLAKWRVESTGLRTVWAPRAVSGCRTRWETAGKTTRHGNHQTSCKSLGKLEESR